MASTRRRGDEGSAVRAALVEAAEKLILETGYPSVTSRTLAEKLNLKRQIVHYYFNTIDDVFIAVIRRNTEKVKAKIAEAEQSKEPLRALQMLSRDPERAILSIELNALAHRRPAVRSEVAKAMAELRALQVRVLMGAIDEKMPQPALRPVVAVLLLSSVARTLALEAAVDVSYGHAETQEFVDDCLKAFAEGRETPFLPNKKAARIPPTSRKASTRKRTT